MNDTGESVLLCVSEAGYIVKTLLENGAQVDLQNKNKSSALLLASENGRAEVAKILLESGAQVDLQGNDGWSALLVASQNGHDEVVKILLEFMAQVNLENRIGLCPLIVAIQNADMVKLLIENGALQLLKRKLIQWECKGKVRCYYFMYILRKFV